MRTRQEHKDIPDGLYYALLAVSFFRARNNLVPRFKKPKASMNVTQMVTRRYYSVQRARAYILLARQYGFRGSVREQAAAIWG